MGDELGVFVSTGTADGELVSRSEEGRVFAGPDRTGDAGDEPGAEGAEDGASEIDGPAQAATMTIELKTINRRNVLPRLAMATRSFRLWRAERSAPRQCDVQIAGRVTLRT